jgi:hypothetical protein
MANGTTVADIINAAQAAIDTVTHQIATIAALQTGGPGDPALDAVKQLLAVREAIYDQMGDAILQSAALAAAVSAMTLATKHMNDTAQNMKTITGVLANLTKFLGFVSQVETALNSVTSAGAGAPKASG